MFRPGVRRPLAILLAVALAGPSLARAAEPAPADFDREIDALVKQYKYREAAVLLAEELKQLPETQENRLRRNTLASKAVSAYREAFRAAPDDCALASSGLVIADEYLDGLVSAYSEGIRVSDEFQGMSRLQTAFDSLRAEHNCPAPGESLPEAAPAPAPAPPPASPKPQTDSGAKRSDRALVAGIAVSASLAAAGLAVAIGTSVHVKRPQGGAYQDILRIAQASFADGVSDNEVPWDDGSDMCTSEARKRNIDVAEACDRALGFHRGSIGSGIAAGVLGVTAIALIAVLVKKRRNNSNAVALLRRHKATLGVSPVGRGGLNVNLGFAF
jgi:hypothetical protein